MHVMIITSITETQKHEIRVVEWTFVWDTYAGVNAIVHPWVCTLQLSSRDAGNLNYGRWLPITMAKRADDIMLSGSTNLLWSQPTVSLEQVRRRFIERMRCNGIYQWESIVSYLCMYVYIGYQPWLSSLTTLPHRRGNDLPNLRPEGFCVWYRDA